MKLYEVSGSQHGSSFWRTLKDARRMFEKVKANGDDVDLHQVEVEISAERQIELLNGEWGNARFILRDLDSYDPTETK